MPVLRVSIEAIRNCFQNNFYYFASLANFRHILSNYNECKDLRERNMQIVVFDLGIIYQIGKNNFPIKKRAALTVFIHIVTRIFHETFF
jgi:hypothetical protein